MQLACVLLGLTEAFGDCRVLTFGLNHGELLIPVDKDIVGDVLLGACPCALESAKRDNLTPYTTMLDNAPACSFQRQG